MELESAYLQLYLAASQVSTLQELIETAHRLSGYSIAAADSIHEIIGVSQDVAAQFGPPASAVWAACRPQQPFF